MLEFKNKLIIVIIIIESDMMSHACNSNTWEAESGGLGV
jgi:hypothetical protein